MKNTKKQMYVAPQIEEFEVELEQGIAAGSQGVAQPGAPSINDYEEGQGNNAWNVDGF